MFLCVIVSSIWLLATLVPRWAYAVQISNPAREFWRVQWDFHWNANAQDESDRWNDLARVWRNNAATLFVKFSTEYFSFASVFFVFGILLSWCGSVCTACWRIVSIGLSSRQMLMNSVTKLTSLYIEIAPSHNYNDISVLSLPLGVGRKGVGWSIYSSSDCVTGKGINPEWLCACRV